MKQVNPDETRNAKQRAQYEQILKDGVCPFCGENFKKYHEGDILKENESWLVTFNDNPYEGSEYHFLFVYTKKHIEHPKDLSEKDQVDLFKLINWISEKYNIDTGAIIMRFGSEGNGSSVRHLHAHIVVGKSKVKSNNKLKVKVGYY
jgi:ATP adenylyltransferase